MSFRTACLSAVRSTVIGVRKATPVVVRATKTAACATAHGTKMGAKATASFSKDTCSTFYAACKEDISGGQAELDFSDKK